MPNSSRPPLRFILAFAIVCSACCTAQTVTQTSPPPENQQTTFVPVVPTDHNGPPTCTPDTPAATGVRPKTARMSAETAVTLTETAATDPTALLAAEPMENFDIARYRIADYADCVGTGGCYWADVDAQYKRAEAALDREFATRKPGEKLAIVLDIDETSLSGYCEMKREDYGYIRAMNDEWTVSPQASVAIPGAVRLFNHAKTIGVDVFFITGRPDRQLQATARNLESAGYHGWKGLALRNTAEAHQPTTTYKSARRAQITAQGYRILMNIGDQWSDLNGTPKAEISVKLPNPFYFLP